VAVDGTRNEIYVVNRLSTPVSQIDGATNAVIGTVSVGSNPHDLAVFPAGDRIYVANQSSNTVTLIAG
jgi:YVTN family beta-propeller protein